MLAGRLRSHTLRITDFYIVYIEKIIPYIPTQNTGRGLAGFTLKHVTQEVEHFNISKAIC